MSVVGEILKFLIFNISNTISNIIYNTTSNTIPPTRFPTDEQILFIQLILTHLFDIDVLEDINVSDIHMSTSNFRFICFYVLCIHKILDDNKI